MKHSIILFLLSILTSQSSFAELNESDNRNFYLHKNNNELGNFRWGNFLACLKTVKFPNDSGPRELNMSIARLVMTTIDNHQFLFSIKEDESSITLESITIDTHKYYTVKDKRRIFLRIVGNCNIQQTTKD